MDVQKWDDIELKPVILVANKSDLVRSRAVSKQGKLTYILYFRLASSKFLILTCRSMSEGRQLALDTDCKYIEVSCTFSMNIDVLLAGISSQLGRKNNITNVKESKNSECILDENVTNFY